MNARTQIDYRKPTLDQAQQNVVAVAALMAIDTLLSVIVAVEFFAKLLK